MILVSYVTRVLRHRLLFGLGLIQKSTMNVLSLHVFTQRTIKLYLRPVILRAIRQRWEMENAFDKFLHVILSE